MPSIIQPGPIEPLFDFGALVFSANVDELVRQDVFDPLTFLRRHICGDWGDLDAEDQQINDEALKTGYRLFSAYQVTPTIRVWVITEADRSSTTFLLPEEY